MATVAQVLEEVREAIQSDPEFREMFEVSGEGVHEENGHFFVPIRMREFPPLRRRIEYYARLAELESRLQADRGMKVVVLPAPDSVFAPA